ncbi:pyridoxal 5'-phosphate synthase glutaminase subunit PdxT [Gardnerella vaginalis]|uniref:Pyridoxal 5'-phosphate synthase subunit PdxT n=1 Tax=Gardnerella vaginalis TaxID=2702 RepID=A0A135Z7X6_GARVA|nr:pyridoxal 5'-phosphate synthase glutaminase subunit PdxT [Gardnerella vaginalis]KXI17770.1 pyridoxal 5'-phosphate synthase, glutaminase subunit Pdx2 [Gardnerella vaginalis]
MILTNSPINTSNNARTVAILAVQGAFLEHRLMLEKLGAHVIELRQERDLEQDFDSLVLPGGESTVQSKLLLEQNMLEPLKNRIANGMPVLGTCAGLILLAKSVQGDSKGNKITGFNTLDVTVKRNAYGRQLGSFHCESDFGSDKTSINIGKVPMTFIRAPYIAEVGDDVEVLASVDNHIVAARQGNQIGTSFHPELDTDTRIHQIFLDL